MEATSNTRTQSADLEADRGSVESRTDLKSLCKIFAQLIVMLGIGIVVIIVFVQKKKDEEAGLIKPLDKGMFTPPTLLAK